MDNLILTPKVFARLVLMNLSSELNVCRTMSHDVSPEFAKKGNKIGSTVMVRRPYRFEVKKGLTYQPQPLVDTMMPITVSQVAQVSYDWDSVEKTLSIREANELYARPAAIALASTINSEAATFCAQNTFNSVGSPGTTPSSQATYLAAGDLIIAQGLPKGEPLSLVVNRRMSTGFVNGVTALFNPTGTISSQFDNGEMVDKTLGYRIMRDQTLNRHTVGTYSGTPLVNGANQTAEGGNNATMTLVTDGWGSGVSGLNKGDKFTIGSATSATLGGVNSVNPQSRVDTGYQQQFTVVNTITDTTGAMSPVIFPAITPSGQYQNVNQAPVDNAIITVVGASGQTGDQGLLMHKTSFAFVSVPMEAPGPGEGAMVAQDTDPDTGLSLRLIKAFDYINSRHINRIDVLYDFGRMYAELACVVQAG